jgi:hypothetical protein
MRSNFVRWSLVFVLLTAMPQVSSAVTSTGIGQNTNSSTTMEGAPTSPKTYRCRTKCRKAYGKCLRRTGDVRRHCIIKYRDCLRHCAQ